MKQNHFFGQWENAERADYSRGRDEPTSQAAFAKACLTISRHHERILRAIHESTGGLTLKEYADMVGLQLNA